MFVNILTSIFGWVVGCRKVSPKVGLHDGELCGISSPTTPADDSYFINKKVSHGKKKKKKKIPQTNFKHAGQV